MRSCYIGYIVAMAALTWSTTASAQDEGEAENQAESQDANQAESQDESQDPLTSFVPPGQYAPLPPAPAPPSPGRALTAPGDTADSANASGASNPDTSGAGNADPDHSDSSSPDSDDASDDADEVITVRHSYIPGSAQTIGEAELQRLEYNNVHQLLSAVPGVYVREEDGYGLRPNIGMRGSGSERSAKIALMEDGVLIVPAPYAAPAAYFFPLITRMVRVDILKGPSAIEYGPNTVGGAINMRSKPVPWRQQGELDAALGGYGYNKLHASYGHASKYAGFLVESVSLGSDGFKVLDTGGNTGFAKKEVLLKARINSDAGADVYHELNIKLGYADEVSNETYTGLSDDDFAATPYRRYAATDLDVMDWRHRRAQLDYRVDLASGMRIKATAYRHEFSRSWLKLNRFNADRTLDEILADPTDGNNAVFYAILRGQADSTSDAEMLLMGTNQRDFVSQGVQVIGHRFDKILGGQSTLDVGARLHQDIVDRYHIEDGYSMLDGALSAAGTETLINRDTTHTALALALYAREKWRRGRLTVTAGARTELIHYDWTDRQMAPASADGTADYFVLIPGAGVVYRLGGSVDVLAGVHKGFVPVSPGQPPEVKPESSINYEAGVRHSAPGRALELIGFFSDYSNINGACTFSSGCLDEQIGTEFNGGSLHVMGIEAAGTVEVPVTPGLSAPIRFSYTFNRSRFRESFTSAFPLWGDVESGDEMPYLPRHQMSVHTGLTGKRGHITAALSYVSGMRDIASQGQPDPARFTAGYQVLDLAAGWNIGRMGQLYVTVDNILDQAYMVSRRPFGSRPGKPRLFTVGYKNQF